MKTVTMPVTTLETLIEGLQNAVNICYNVDSQSDDGEKSYPFATGYSRSTMECVIQDLQRLVENAN
jgi:hypothetical protein